MFSNTQKSSTKPQQFSFPVPDSQAKYQLKTLEASVIPSQVDFRGECKSVIVKDYLLCFTLEDEQEQYRPQNLKAWALDLNTLTWHDVKYTGRKVIKSYTFTLHFCQYNDKIIMLYKADEVNSGPPKKGVSAQQRFLQIDVLTFDTQGFVLTATELSANEIPLRFKYLPHVDNKDLYIFGGLDSMSKVQNKVYGFDLESKQGGFLGSKGGKIEGREGYASIIYNDKLYVYGGWNKDNRSIKDFWQYNFNTFQWKELTTPDLPDLSNGRLQAFGDSIYLLGEKSAGFLSNDSLAYLFSYSIEKGSWELLQESFMDNHKPVAFEIYQNQLILAFKSNLIVFPQGGSSKQEKDTVKSNDVIKAPENNKNLLFTEKTDTDISFRIGGNLVPAHKSIIAAKCGYFDKMFTNDMHENIIEISDMSPETFNSFLEYIYNDEVKLTEELAIELLNIAGKYNVLPLRSECETFLGNCLNVSNVVDISITANEVGAKSLEKLTVTFIKKNLDAVVEKHDIKRLPQSVLLDIMKEK